MQTNQRTDTNGVGVGSGGGGGDDDVDDDKFVRMYECKLNLFVRYALQLWKCSVFGIQGYHRNDAHYRSGPIAR
jgi:hypothetical protein